MAYEIPCLVISLRAAADLTAKQFYFVKLDSSGYAAMPTAATDVPIGVLQNAPDTGEEATVMVMGVSKVSSDAALAIGNLIGVASDGQADAKTAGGDTTEYTVGQVLVASAAAAGYATAAINCANPHRSA